MTKQTKPKTDRPQMSEMEFSELRGFHLLHPCSTGKCRYCEEEKKRETKSVTDKKKYPSIIEVEWVDSHSHSGWGTKKEYLKDVQSRTPIISVGFLFSETEDYLCLVQSYGNKQYESVIQIPIKSILKRTKIK